MFVEFVTKSISQGEIGLACFGEKLHGQGEYLVEATRKRREAGEHVSHCGRMIFPADSPLTRTPEEKEVDDEAVRMVGAGGRTT